MSENEKFLWCVIAVLLGIVVGQVLWDRTTPLPLNIRVRREPWEPDGRGVPIGRPAPLDPPGPGREQ